MGEEVVEYLPNGREIREREEGAERFLVQPPNDNYWKSFASQEEASDWFFAEAERLGLRWIP